MNKCALMIRYLYFYCAIVPPPNCTTGQSPSDLFLKRHVRTRLDFLKPNIQETVRRKQYLQKNLHDYQARERSFAVNESVSLRNTVGGDPKWLSGVVVQQTGPVSYKVRDPLSTTVYRRHGDQLRPRLSASETYDEQLMSRSSVETQEPEKEMIETSSPDPGLVETSTTVCESELPVEPPESLVASPVGLRRSKRTIQLPQRFRD